MKSGMHLCSALVLPRGVRSLKTNKPAGVALSILVMAVWGRGYAAAATFRVSHMSLHCLGRSRKCSWALSNTLHGSARARVLKRRESHKELKALSAEDPSGLGCI